MHEFKREKTCLNFDALSVFFISFARSLWWLCADWDFFFCFFSFWTMQMKRKKNHTILFVVIRMTIKKSRQTNNDTNKFPKTNGACSHSHCVGTAIIIIIVENLCSLKCAIIFWSTKKWIKTTFCSCCRLITRYTHIRNESSATAWQSTDEMKCSLVQVTNIHRQTNARKKKRCKIKLQKSLKQFSFIILL